MLDLTFPLHAPRGTDLNTKGWLLVLDPCNRQGLQTSPIAQASPVRRPELPAQWSRSSVRLINRWVLPRRSSASPYSLVRAGVQHATCR